METGICVGTTGAPPRLYLESEEDVLSYTEGETSLGIREKARS